MEIQRVTRRLDAAMVEEAYRNGIFPMADTALGLVTWHRPRRRAILPLDAFHVSRSLGRTLRRGNFSVTFDRDFAGVMEACASRRPTWISDEFRQVYGELHRAGKAHSVEVWVEGLLAGGVYGVGLGGAFFAESKFHRVTDMSKVALAHLVRRLRERGFALLEVQYRTEHLAQFGVVEIPNKEYLGRLRAALELDCRFD
ncbi:MAG TPA: leucyl/phenylalanyl-tRNA--protein transferase [Bryobacteraceae bacterium]|jgi:leucyl/phenylalanyl-tRNA---protein transferase|nr:leucyl/phenylalanyl-tRNA--protein transferase [Bryobacteraceae bacterium]